MRYFLFLLVGFVGLMLGCTDRPEVSPSAYGTILETLPEPEESKEPFPFPIGEDGNDHQKCVFDEADFL